MDFESETKRARLKSVHPWSSVDEVVKNTGFELVIPDGVPVTDEPPDEEVEIIRSCIDVEGLLRE
jgi:acyl CoA:acetate/3-ketoacid CoA transferase beta subunit